MSDLENQNLEDHKIIVEDANTDHPTIHEGQDDDRVTKVITHGDFIQFGKEKYSRNDLIEAFGGSMNPGLSPPPKHDFANPAPLGMSCFALTLFVLSLINVEARGVNIPNIVVGLAYFYGGAAQLIAGLFEIAVGNTFGGVALSSYAGFWGSWASFQIDSFGIATAYGENREEYRFALGLFYVGWFIFTFLLLLLTLKSTVAFFSIFLFLSLTFLLLAITEFKDSTSVRKAAGVFGLLASFALWYNAYAGIANEQNSYIPVKAIQIPDFQEKRKIN